MDQFRQIHLAAAAVSVLQARDGMHSIVRLSDGATHVVWNISWSNEFGHGFDHLYSNANPSLTGVACGDFFSSEIASITTESGRVVFDAQA